MFELNLEQWEQLPDNFEEMKPLIQSICYPMIPEKPEIGTTYRIYPDGCVSANGTAYHGGIRIGKNPKKLIIYFNGGGISFNEYTASRPNNAFTGHIKDTYYSNDGEWIGDYFLREGMNADREDNPFLDWCLINILYCNGDFHCGGGEFRYTAQDGSKRVLPHHGYQNAMSVIEMAKKWIPEPEQILIAGSSAGGFGTALLSDDVIQAFPTCRDITCVVDSSLLFSKKWEQIAKEVWHSPEHIQKRLVSDNLMLDSYTALYQKYGDKVRYLFMSSVRDALLVAAQNALDGKGQITDKESGIRYQKNLEEICRQLVENIPNVGLYIFTGPMDAPGHDEAELTLHCALNNPYVFSHKEDGKTPCEWILNAMQGRVERLGLHNLC
ncbi:pectin acetylesterase-family hydrolase [Robinsoniella peoriensis]